MARGELTENQKRDYQKYFVESPIGFSPERNKAVIEQTIKETNEESARRHKSYMDQVEARVDAAADYVLFLDKMKFNGKEGFDPAERYFGKRILAELQGRKIVNKIIDAKKKIIGVDILD